MTLALTLTLSPAERELSLFTPRISTSTSASPAASIRGRRRKVLPLLGGEGWGEGGRGHDPGFHLWRIRHSPKTVKRQLGNHETQEKTGRKMVWARAESLTCRVNVIHSWSARLLWHFVCLLAIHRSFVV